MEDGKRERLAEAGFIGRDVAIRRFADTVLADIGDIHTIAIGPLVWDLKPGYDIRYWYFVAATADAHGEFHIDSLTVPNNERAVAEECQLALVAELASRKPPMAIHTFDDELDMMRFCEIAFPCAKTRDLRASVERDRQS